MVSTEDRADTLAAVWEIVRPTAVWWAHDAAARGLVVLAEHALQQS